MPVLLVVDDQANVRRSLKTAMELDGYQVLTAGSISEAMNLLATSDIDAVILDLLIPGDDSFAFLKQIKSSRPNVKAIAVSGDKGMLKRASEADFILAKPLQTKAIQQALKNII